VHIGGATLGNKCWKNWQQCHGCLRIKSFCVS